MRKPNVNCTVCKHPLYRRPNEVAKSQNFYCSVKCKDINWGTVRCKTCKVCKKPFTHKRVDTLKHRIYCSKSCANSDRRGIHYGKEGSKNRAKKRLEILQNTFHIFNCMVEGCTYDKVLEIHRHLEGKDGGKYEIGNMFSICPNHHAEITRKVTTVVKINDYTLKAV